MLVATISALLLKEKKFSRFFQSIQKKQSLTPGSICFSEWVVWLELFKPLIAPQFVHCLSNKARHNWKNNVIGLQNSLEGTVQILLLSFAAMGMFGTDLVCGTRTWNMNAAVDKELGRYHVKPLDFQNDLHKVPINAKGKKLGLSFKRPAKKRKDSACYTLIFLSIIMSS